MSNNQYSLESSPESIVLDQAWVHVLERLHTEVQAAWYSRFIKPLKPVSLDESGLITIVTPGQFVKDWVQARYAEPLKVMLGDELGREVRIEFQVEPNERKVKSTSTAVVNAPAVAVVSEPFMRDQAPFKPNQSYLFENFVVGQCNRFAHAGASAVASQLGVRYNPLFIYSQPGLGKTHLLHSIANEVLKRDPGFKLAYVMAQEFAEDYVAALQNHRMDQFRKMQRNIDLWLVDEIQFIAGKDKTQEEIFYTFNHLYSLGKQIVICSDRAPKDLYLLDERLRSRFESGLVVDIQLPDTETRSAIMLKKSQAIGLVINTTMAMILAERVQGDVRQLEGSLRKLEVYASLHNRTLDEELCVAFVNEYYNATAMEKPGLDQIIALVSRYFKVSEEEIMGTSRKAPIVHARHVAVYITRSVTGDSWKHIGMQFGGRDHTSMMHGFQKIDEMIHRNKDFKGLVQSLIDTIAPRS